MAEYRIPDTKRIGFVLREVRHRRGLTQADTARRAGVSRGWLVKLEQGHGTAEIEPVFRVATALGLSLILADAPPQAALDKMLGLSNG